MSSSASEEASVSLGGEVGVEAVEVRSLPDALLRELDRELVVDDGEAFFDLAILLETSCDIGEKSEKDK